MAQAANEFCKIGGGGMEGVYVNSIYELNRLTLKLDNFGVQLKYYSRGLN